MGSKNWNSGAAGRFTALTLDVIESAIQNGIAIAIAYPANTTLATISARHRLTAANGNNQSKYHGTNQAEAINTPSVAHPALAI
ncbi:MAG: hypothetical protein WBK99_00165 [Solirubrobacterales bacterium]